MNNIELKDGRELVVNDHVDLEELEYVSNREMCFLIIVIGRCRNIEDAKAKRDEIVHNYGDNSSIIVVYTRTNYYRFLEKFNSLTKENTADDLPDATVIHPELDNEEEQNV